MLRKSADLSRELTDAFEALIDRVRALVGSADAALLSRRPAEDAWSAAECIDHLNTSARLY